MHAADEALADIKENHGQNTAKLMHSGLKSYSDIKENHGQSTARTINDVVFLCMLPMKLWLLYNFYFLTSIAIFFTAR